jgi:FtsP/CotA-like multicopper oxidase with cupredoxin domain
MPIIHLRSWGPISGLLIVCAVVAAASGRTHRALPVVSANPNTERAGALHDGVLTVTLEAEETLWHLNGPTRSPMTIAAFAEPGKGPLMPGPLLRAPVGTELRISMRNSLRVPLTFQMPASIHGGPDEIAAMDSIVVAPGAVGTLTTHATVAGNYIYRATSGDGASRVEGMTGLLGGGLVVDRAQVSDAPPRDRVLVIMVTEDSAAVACSDTATRSVLAECPGRRFRNTINGGSWPNTERMHAVVGDSLHWRVINASNQVHPVHLHGFYYRVDEYSSPLVAVYGRPAPGQMVVTQLMAPLSAMSMTWSPDRPGNWLFHCHFAIHNRPDSLSAAPDDPHMREMNGLLVGTIVTARAGVTVTRDLAAARQLRLVAELAQAVAGKGLDDVPLMHFVLEEHGRRVDTHTDLSPELDLTRGEPVSITIVNHLEEPTSVHWHGIEVQDSYMDGAPEFSGAGRHLTPAIAPGDSFVARFTPPRSGTFMYHAHIDEVPEQLAGLEGALIVRDPGARPSPDDYVIFLKGSVLNRDHPLEIDGQRNPDTLVLHVGRAARLRLLNLATSVVAAAPSFWLTTRPDSAPTSADDTMVVRWLPVAKDGFDLPPAAQLTRPAQQVVAMGETYDFEYTPRSQGTMRLEVRTPRAPHSLLIRVPIRVEQAGGDAKKP